MFSHIIAPALCMLGIAFIGFVLLAPRKWF